jgi:hypothetical protein
MFKDSQASGSKKPVAFVAMCFDGRLQHVYHKVVKPVLENHGFLCIRGDEISQTGVLMDQIRDAINHADLVICDLTFENPNVFYELGMAHVLEKSTILTSQSPGNIPFDVRHRRVIPYEDTKIGLLDLRAALVDTLMKMLSIDRESYLDRPPKDFPGALNELEGQRAALFSTSLDLKRYAIKFLGDHADRASYEKIEMIAVSDSNVDVVRDAFTALFKIDPPKARSLLISTGLRRQKEFLVRERVVGLLGTLPPDKELLEQMKAQLGDSSWGVRRTVYEVLGRWGQSSAVGPLQQMLSDPEPLVRLAAAEALERLHEHETESIAPVKSN